MGETLSGRTPNPGDHPRLGDAVEVTAVGEWYSESIGKRSEVRLIVDGKPILLPITPDMSVRVLQSVEQQAAGEPRQFPSDGPEPPADVECLEWLGFVPAVHGLRFSKRVPGRGQWAWVLKPTDVVAEGCARWSWAPHAQLYRGGFREVLS